MSNSRNIALLAHTGAEAGFHRLTSAIAPIITIIITTTTGLTVLPLITIS
jgi:hypothetical protein